MCWKRGIKLSLTHPDQAYARYIHNGFRHGFRVGFQHGSPLRSASRNMPSADQHPESVNEYIHRELSKGRMLGPFSDSMQLPPLHINRMGTVPKGHGSGKQRIITDLSFPTGRSINDGVDPALCSMAYISVEEVAALVAQLLADPSAPPGPIPTLLNERARSISIRCCHSDSGRLPRSSNCRPLDRWAYYLPGLPGHSD